MPPRHPSLSDDLIRAAQKLRVDLRRLRFAPPVTHVYNPMDYAWEPYQAYLNRFAITPKRVVFLGMNPGPFGMAQTGIPFGDIPSVRDWLKIQGSVGQPDQPHPSRPVAGFDCERVEVSGRRLWGLFSARFGEPQAFFKDHIVINYCPLAFMEESGRNRTPDKLPPAEKEALFRICDRHLSDVVTALRPEWVVGIGGFAFGRLNEVFGKGSLKVGQVLHPSPACPAANKDWTGTVTAQLIKLGIW